MTFVPPPTLFFGRAQCYSEFLTILYCPFTWHCSFGRFCTQHSATFYFSCCILHNVLQIDSFFNWKCSTVHQNYYYCTSNKDDLLASHCSSCNSVTVSPFFLYWLVCIHWFRPCFVSASLHTLVQAMFFRAFGHDKSASPCILGSKNIFCSWLEKFESSSATVNL